MKPALIRIGAIVIKEFKHLWRDRRVLATVLIMPIMQVVLFSYAISFDVKDVPTVFVDQDRTPASREYLQGFRATDLFKVLGEASDPGAVDRLFDHNAARVVIIVPSGYERALASGAKATVAVLIDGSEPNAAKVAQSYVTAINERYNQRVLIEWADRQGLDPSQAGHLEPRVRTWYNPDRTSSIFLIPGLLVVIIMIVTVQQTAVTLVRERTQGTQEQMMVSPLRRIELMIGKLLPWTMLAFAEMVVITLIGMLLFGVPLRGNVLALGVATIVFVFASLGIGLIISAVAPSLETANVAALMIAFLPAFVLSGFAFPLESVPVVLQWISHLFPARYMVDISRGVFLKAAGFGEIWQPLMQLVVYAVVVLLLATLIDRRRAR